MAIFSKTLSFIMKQWLYVVLILGMVVYGYFRRNSPTHPDPASGHVLRVVTPHAHSRTNSKTVIYLTSSELSLYHASFIAIAASTLGIIGSTLIRNRNRATSSG